MFRSSWGFQFGGAVLRQVPLKRDVTLADQERRFGDEVEDGVLCRRRFLLRDHKGGRKDCPLAAS